MDVIRLMLVSLAGWMNHQQQKVIDYLQGYGGEAWREITRETTKD